MANIDNELKIIKEEGRGETVRAAIIDAISKIYNEREYPATTKKFTRNTGPDGETGGPWNRVIVDVQGGGASANIDNLNGTITENDWYTIDKLKALGLIDNENCVGINGFTVNVGQHTGEYGEITITQNGTYDPLLDGFDGYSKVYVNVLGGDYRDYYTVRFYDGTRMIEAVQVARGTNAVCTRTNQLTGGIFTGWNPNPVNVSRDMNCYAVYVPNGVIGAGDYVESIADNWETIANKVKNGNRPYQEGSTKFLRLKGYGGTEYLLNMMLIGYTLDKNANGGYAASTWININPSVTVFQAQNQTDMNYIFGKYSLGWNNGSGHRQVDNNGGTTIWWQNSLARAIFNADPTSLTYTAAHTADTPNDKDYYDSLSALGLLLPTVIDRAAGTNLFDKMVQVQKFSYQRNFGGSSGSVNYDLPNSQTLDKIWIPCLYEMACPLASGTKPTDMCSSGTNYGNPNVWTKTMANNGHADGGTMRDMAAQQYNIGMIQNIKLNINTTNGIANRSGGFAPYYGSQFYLGFCL